MHKCITAALWAGGSLALLGCPADSELAELRLFPCLVDGTEPASLRVELQPRDGAGMPVGDAKTGVYAVEQSVFGDGYATLGYRPVEGSSTIDVQVWWYASEQAGSAEEADAISVYTGIAAPSAGQVVDLGSENCDSIAGTDGSTTLEPTDTESTSSSSSTTEPTETTTSTTMGVTDSTTTMDSTSMGTTTMMGSTTDDTTGSTTGGEMTMEGELCFVDQARFCEPQSVGGGKLLLCTMGTWQVNHVAACMSICSGVFPMQPNPIGCAGDGADYVCLCQADVPDLCTPADNECASNELLTLCVDGEESVARCPGSNCLYTAPQDYTCSI